MHRDDLAAQIANSLAADVRGGTLKPGEMFPSERDLCDRFDASRSVVRDGMKQVNRMGLSDHSKGKRPRVAAPSLSRLMLPVSEAAQFLFEDNEGKAHLDQGRLFLETSMLRYSIEHATNAQIGKMVSAIEECEENLDNVAAFRRGDVKFHRAFAEVPGNPIFVALHETFVEEMMKNQPMHADYQKHNEISNAGHKQIVTAVMAKDVDTAVRALTLHLTRNYESDFHQSLAVKMGDIS